MPARRWRSVGLALVVAAVVACVGASPSTAATHAMLRDATTSTATVRVVVVVDFGPHSKESPRIVIKCLKVPVGTNGSVVLADVASSFHVPAPTYSTSGLLCSIDGYPSKGCGTPEPRGYAYWSYWHGGGHWTYADLGPAEWTVRDEDVEGWRYQPQGAANPTDPAPAESSDFATACAAAATSPSPMPARSGTTSGSAPLLGAAALVVVVLGGAGAARWRRRPRT